MQKILKSKKHYDQVGDWTKVMKGGRFSIKAMYQILQGDWPAVPWKRLICHNKATPKSVFILWLALHKRLPTKDRLIRWGINCAAVCPLCMNVDESLDHLFFQCSFSAEVWHRVMQWIGIQSLVCSFDQEVSHMARIARKKGDHAKLTVMAFTEIIYALWCQRNSRIFGSIVKQVNVIVREIVYKMACRSDSAMRSLLIL